MNPETLRWFGTTLIAGLFGLIALIGMIAITIAGRPVPTELTVIAVSAATGFFAVFGGMVGARASQNGAQVQQGAQPTGHE